MEVVVDLVVVWEAEGAALEVSARVPEGEPEARYRLSIASTSRARDTTRVILRVAHITMISALASTLACLCSQLAGNYFRVTRYSLSELSRTEYATGAHQRRPKVVGVKSKCYDHQGIS